MLCLFDSHLPHSLQLSATKDASTAFALRMECALAILDGEVLLVIVLVSAVIQAPMWT
jgi:hypothetical protein